MHRSLQLKLKIFAVALLLFTQGLLADLANPVEFENLKQSTRLEVRSKLTPLLERYCGESCQIIDITVNVEEMLPDAADLGFEGVDENKKEEKFRYFVDQVNTEIQIDRRISQKSRERLQLMLANHLKHVGVSVQILWTPVDLPGIGATDSEQDSLKQQLEAKISGEIAKVINRFCPNQCILSSITAMGTVRNYDEVDHLDARELVKAKSSNTYFQVNQVEVALSLDASLSPAMRERIVNVMKAKTSFVHGVNFTVDVTDFPESYLDQKARKDAESADPYGLGRLKETLTLFRDLAGTKEIISSTASKDTSSSSAESMSRDAQEQQWFIYLIVILLVGGVIAFILLKYTTAKQNADEMIHALRGMPAQQNYGSEASQGVSQSSKKLTTPKDLSLSLQVADLKQELVNILVESPRVAKETFTHMIQDDGIEDTAKYVHIFGKMIVFELLNDPNLQRHLYELSEFYHKSHFDFSLEEEERLLQNLKTRVTANEIRVLTRKTMEQFDFILKLDAAQIYTLVNDENPQVQSIVLTQLPPSLRRSVFNMFEGKNRVSLMNELCKADAIPKEYLANVAKAMHKKVLAKPQFDTQNLRSSDILLDLIERSSLTEQRLLMKKLVETNPDAARAIKLKLVTLEILPYFKDGQLLEIVLGMDREDLLSFLIGTKTHIRDLLIAHAPRELSQSWLEDMENMSRVDEERYHLVELSILNKIRHFANLGSINLLDINEMLFADVPADSEQSSGRGPRIARESIVA